MKVIVTGGVGFIGSHTVELLKKCDCDVYILDNFSTGKMKNIQHLLCDRVRVADVDIRHADSVLDAFRTFKPEGVIHLAAQSAITTSISDPGFDATNNILGTLNILRMAQKYEVKRFVFASTSAVYREKKALFRELKEHDDLFPTSPYGISKMAAEFYIRTMFPSHVILRYANVYGPRQVPIGENQVIPRMIKHFKYGDKFYIHGSGNQERDFIYVEDVARANVDALYGNPGVYNVATGHSFKVNDVATMVGKYYEVPGYLWEHTKKEDPRGSVHMDASEARSGLGWSFKTSLQDGIVKTIDWWEAQK